MKIILSRKGFDSRNGGCASPIMPDGTLLSMPIPETDGIGFDELAYDGMSYSDILKDLNPKESYNQCHLDPDIRENARINSIPNWKPAFGQTDAAQGVLANAGVGPGDIFLFFGWFKCVKDIGGRYRFTTKGNGDFYHSSDLNVIYGYMQVGDIITDQRLINEYYWHPHAFRTYNNSNNTLYVPTERLSLIPDKKGYGVLDYREDRVLTMEGMTRGIWKELEFLMPQHIYGDRKNSAKEDGLFYSGIWQELVVYESPGLIDWVTGILSDDANESHKNSAKEVFSTKAETEKEELPGKPKVRPGSTVRHYKYGIGTVKRIERDMIYVSFAGEEKQFQYPYVFENNYMTLEG